MAGCTDPEDPFWDKVVPDKEPFAISIKPLGADPRFSANIQVFHADGTIELFNKVPELVPGPKKSKTLGSPNKTNVVMARVLIDPTSSSDTKLEVTSTIGTRTHCHTVAAKGLTLMVHTIRMAAS